MHACSSPQLHRGGQEGVITNRKVVRRRACIKGWVGASGRV